jgi:hypothetical protein
LATVATPTGCQFRFSTRVGRLRTAVTTGPLPVQ